MFYKMNKKDQSIENALGTIRRRRLTVLSSFVSLFAIFFICRFFDFPEVYIFFIIAGGVLVMIPLIAHTGLSTCPKCNRNYFGGFYKIDKNKCENCGLSLNDINKN